MTSFSFSRLFTHSLLGATALSLLPVASFAQGIEEIVVTARKRDETKLEIPIAVTALDQGALDDRGISTTESLAGFTPGFDFQNQGQGGTSGRENPLIRFRGIAVQQSSPAARAGAVFWDGAYISDGAGILPLVDLERAEVIKGPQTAFFGRNTFAGAVNYVSAVPGEELSGKASLEVTPSEENGYSITGAIGGPIGERFGFRIAGTSQTKGADYQFRDGSLMGTEETLGFLGSLNFDATENLRFRLSGFFVDSEDTRNLSSQVAPVAAGDCNRTFSGNLRAVGTGEIVGSFTTDISQSPRATFCGTLPDWDDVPINLTFEGSPTAASSSVFFGGGLAFTRRLPVEFEGKDFISAPDRFGNQYEVWRNHLSAEYDFASGHTLSGFISQGESQHWSNNDANYGTPILFGDIWFTGFIKNIEDTSIEVRLNSPSENRLRYTLGISHYDQETLSGTFPLFAGFDPNIFIGGLPRASIDAQEGTNLGVFGSLDYDINDQLTLSVEGRWNDDEQEITYEGPSGGPIAALGDAAVTGEVQQYSAFMPRLILSWQPPGRSMNIYGSYSKSFLQGIPTDAAGYAAAFPAAGINPATVGFFTPRQELEVLEVGIKHRWGSRLYYSVAVYNQEWANQTFFELAPVTFTPLNLSGDTEAFGIDAEFQADPTDWLSVTGGISWNDVEFTDSAGTGSIVGAVLFPDISLPQNAGLQVSTIGNQPRYIPEYTGSLSATVQAGSVFGKPLSFRVDGVYTGDFYIDNFEWNQVEGYWKWNLRAAMQLTDTLKAEVFGLNVTDDRSWITSGGTTSITASPNRKTFGLAARGAEWGVRIMADF